MKKRKGPFRSRSLSLTSLVGELTINKWNSNSSFEEKSIGIEGEEVKIITTVNVDDNSVDPETPQSTKRRLSPNELTPLGKTRKMSTEVYNSPILRMKHMFWTMGEADIGPGVTGVTPANNPSTNNVEGRYGLVGVVNEVNDNLTAPAVSAGARHSPAVVVDEVNDNFIAPVESTGARYGPVEGANDGLVFDGSNIKQECGARMWSKNN